MIGTDILTEEELRMISGHHTRDGMIAWLNNHKITFLMAKNGWPRVHVKVLEAAMGVGSKETSVSAPAQFNFEALR